jgi:hypothetical protein
MLMAHPAILEDLMDRYETLRFLDPHDPQVRRRVDDLAYTLCVATGTSDVEMALIAARMHLPGAGPLDDSLAA